MPRASQSTDYFCLRCQAPAFPNSLIDLQFLAKLEAVEGLIVARCLALVMSLPRLLWVLVLVKVII